MIPTLHLNGSSPDKLKEDLCEVTGCLRKAMDAMSRSGPNARDYYVQSEGAFSKAEQEHRDRLERLRAVRAEYEQILEGLQDQIDARAARRSR
jgi:hypothetical protein